MQALDLLLNRVSCSKLQEPAPTPEQRTIMYQAALRAADHAQLKPWRILEIEGDGLGSLGDCFKEAMLTDNPAAEASALEKITQKPFRAPLVLVAIARFQDHPKVPRWEQLITAGAAVQNLIGAAFAQGVGAYWRTGVMTEHQVVRNALNIGENEQIIGFVYLGTPAVPLRRVEPLEIGARVERWPAI